MAKDDVIVVDGKVIDLNDCNLFTDVHTNKLPLIIVTPSNILIFYTIVKQLIII